MKKLWRFFAEIPSWYLIIPIFPLVFILFHLNGDCYVKPTEFEQKTIEILESVQPQSKVLIISNFGPEAKYELETALSAVIGLLVKKNVGLVFAAMAPTGIESSLLAVEKSIKSGNLGKERFVYGSDYVHLGYIAGGNIASFLLAGNLKSARKQDVYNNDLQNYPVMNGIKDLSDFAAVIEFSSQTIDGVPGIVSLSLLSKSDDTQKIAFSTSDMVSAYIPFYDSQYIDGFVGGFKSATSFVRALQPASSVDKNYFIMSGILIYVLLLVAISNLADIFRGK